MSKEQECGAFVHPVLLYRCMLPSGHQGAHSLLGPHRRVIQVQTEDGLMHTDECTVCGMIDPDANPAMHSGCRGDK